MIYRVCKPNDLSEGATYLGNPDHLTDPLAVKVFLSFLCKFSKFLILLVLACAKISVDLEGVIQGHVVLLVVQWI